MCPNGPYCTENAILCCPFGLLLSRLTIANERHVILSNNRMANISDFKPMADVMPFGICCSPTNPAVISSMGCPAPCTPVISTPWTNLEPVNVLVQGMPAITNSSTLQCLNSIPFFSISVTHNGQFQTPGFPGVNTELIHTLLDVAGLIPGVGILPDLLNSFIYAVEGNNVDAMLSLGAAIPFLGYGAAGSKLVKTVAKTVEKRGGSKAAKELMQWSQKWERSVQQDINSLKKKIAGTEKKMAGEVKNEAKALDDEAKRLQQQTRTTDKQFDGQIKDAQKQADNAKKEFEQAASENPASAETFQRGMQETDARRQVENLQQQKSAAHDANQAKADQAKQARDNFDRDQALEQKKAGNSEYQADKQKMEQLQQEQAKAHEAASADANAYKEASKEASKENGLKHNAKEYFYTEDKEKSLGEYLFFDKKDFTDTVTSPKNTAIFIGGKATDKVITNSVNDNIKEHINNNGSNSPSSTDEEQREKDYNKYL